MADNFLDLLSESSGAYPKHRQREMLLELAGQALCGLCSVLLPDEPGSAPELNADQAEQYGEMAAILAVTTLGAVEKYHRHLAAEVEKNLAEAKEQKDAG